MKVGDLVRLRGHRYHSGSLGIVVSRFNVAVKLWSIETGQIIPAIKDNLELVSGDDSNFG